MVEIIFSVLNLVVFRRMRKNGLMPSPSCVCVCVCKIKCLYLCAFIVTVDRCMRNLVRTSCRWRPSYSQA